jgi:ABC-2 type transport system ATP-binding protein
MTNYSDRVSEIRDFFANGDLELGRRRLLDLAYDADDAALLRECIAWSRTFLPDEGAPKPEQIDSALKLLDRIPDPNNRHEAKLLLTAKGLSKTYRSGHFTLKDVDMQLSEGQVIGIVGENGNGKTTFLRQVATELQPDTGELEWLYVQPRINQYYDVKNATGFIPQRIPRWFGILRDNLAFTAAIHDQHGETNDLHVDFVLERFGLSKFAQLKWTQISSGYRTRFEIARIMLLRPQLLILDEPLANLDINAQQTLLQDLKYLARSNRHPMGVLLSSQQLYEVEKIADEVMFISKGRTQMNVKQKAGEETETDVLILEMETGESREKIVQALGDRIQEIRFNGGLYQLHFKGSVNELFAMLASANLNLKYFRDITHSTKRFF